MSTSLFVTEGRLHSLRFLIHNKKDQSLSYLCNLGVYSELV